MIVFVCTQQKEYYYDFVSPIFQKYTVDEKADYHFDTDTDSIRLVVFSGGAFEQEFKDLLIDGFSLVGASMAGMFICFVLMNELSVYFIFMFVF